jgi:hypothetical protein
MILLGLFFIGTWANIGPPGIKNHMEILRVKTPVVFYIHQDANIFITITYVLMIWKIDLQ